MNWVAPQDIKDDVRQLLKDDKLFPILKMDAPLTIVCGSAGSGKTRWAAMVTTAGSGWAYANARELINDMRATCMKTKDAVGSREKFIQNTPRLVIDDLGDETQTPFSVYKTVYQPVEILRNILMARCRSDIRTIITTNLAVERLAEIYDHDQKTHSHRGRVFSRFSNHARIYTFQGDRRKGEEVQVDEVLKLNGGVDSEGKPRPEVKIGNPIKTTMGAYEELEKEAKPEELTAPEVREAIKSVAGKEELEAAYYMFLTGTKHANLIPKEWHERQKARERKVKLEAKAREEREKERAAVRASGDNGDSDSGTDGLQRGAGKGSGAGGGAAGGVGASGEVDTSSVPDWGKGG